MSDPLPGINPTLPQRIPSRWRKARALCRIAFDTRECFDFRLGLVHCSRWMLLKRDLNSGYLLIELTGLSLVVQQSVV